MRPATGIVVLLLSALASAQTDEDRRAVLQEIASSSRAAKSWLAEGVQVRELTGRGMNVRAESHFKVAWQSPSKMLLETSTNETMGGMDRGLPSGTLMVCDGADHWTHYSPGASFYRASVTVSPCKPEMGDFSKVAENLVSATLIGRDRVQVAGAAKECEIVRAEYAIPMAPGNSSTTARSIRTLCIDPGQKRILRDRAEFDNATGTFSVETTTYSSYERDPDLPADLFQFHVPTGYFEDDGPTLPGDTIVEDGVYRNSIQVSAPTLISKIEPSYTAEAFPGVSGIVLVSFQVNPDGNPAKVKVVRGLGHGLDEKAVGAVSGWHFHPGTKDGVPVTVGPLRVAVSFARP